VPTLAVDVGKHHIPLLFLLLEQLNLLSQVGLPCVLLLFVLLDLALEVDDFVFKELSILTLLGRLGGSLVLVVEVVFKYVVIPQLLDTHVEDDGLHVILTV